MRTVCRLAVVTIVLLTGCSAAETSAETPSPQASPSESSTEPAPVNYGTTNCAQWAYELTAKQRKDSALDMLLIARRVMDPDAGAPSAKLAAKWEANLTEACPVSIESLYIAGAASLLYRMDQQIYNK